jgi:putative transposase
MLSRKRLLNTAAAQLFNTHQGSQFTSAEFTSVLINNAISSSMDGKGAGETTSSSSASGEPSSPRESICTPMKRFGEARPSIARYIAFSTQCDLTSLLTPAPRIKPTSIRCRSARQLNPRADDPLRDAEILFKDRGRLTRHPDLP